MPIEELCIDRWQLKGDTYSCTKPKGHTDNHSYRKVEPSHTYYVELNNGLYSCCLKFLAGFIKQAYDEKWPIYQPGFKTRCTDCTGWIKLQGDTFVYEPTAEEMKQMAIDKAREAGAV